MYMYIITCDIFYEYFVFIWLVAHNNKLIGHAMFCLVATKKIMGTLN